MAGSQLCTAGHDCLLLGTIVYCWAQLSTAEHNCLLLELHSAYLSQTLQALPALTAGFKTWTDWLRLFV